MGGQEIYLNEVQQYLQQMPACLATLEDALQSEDIYSLKMAAHAKKGVSANLALNQLQDLCDALEQINESDWSEAPALVTQLADATALLTQAVTPLLKTVAEPEAPAAATASTALPAEAIAALKQLRALAQAGELDDSLFQTLQHHSPVEYRQPLSLIAQLLNDFDFEQTVVHIEQILTSQETL